jgi:hypothetical protein
LAFRTPPNHEVLPYPFNKGGDWCLEAVSAIKADVAQFGDIDEWRLFCSDFDVFQNNKEFFEEFYEECHLEQLYEGLKLLGL